MYEEIGISSYIIIIIIIIIIIFTVRIKIMYEEIGIYSYIILSLTVKKWDPAECYFIVP